MSGNDELVMTEPITEVRPVRTIPLEDRLWAITRLGVASFILWLIGILMFDGIGRLLYGTPSGTTFLPEPFWFGSSVLVIFLYFLWGLGVTIKHYGGGRLSSGLKLPFIALKDAILIAAGKKYPERDNEDGWY